jgi:hypothetical protein
VSKSFHKEAKALRQSLVAVNSLIENSNPQNAAFSAARMNDLLFAYGSNMNLSQIRTRCSNPVVISTARLADHRLMFYGHSDVWDGGVETVEPAPGHAVWGVLFSLSRLNWERLDLWQDARMDGAGMYFHFPASVMDPDGHEHKVRLYKKDIQNKATDPSREYLRHIVQGAVENGLPGGYVEVLSRRTAKDASYIVPERGSSDLGRSAGASCSDCAA